MYKNGNSLAPHKDRPACEISVTLMLGCESDVNWPIHFETNGGEIEIEMEPGDAIVYRGCDLKHWRQRFYGDHHAQDFLHYVDQAGAYAEHKFDKRPMLGTLRTGRTKTVQLNQIGSRIQDWISSDFNADVENIP